MKNGATLADVKSLNARARGVVDWRPAFLSALENVGVICKAAEAAEVSAMTVWREKKNNPDFAAAYDEAVTAGALLLEAEAVRRARDGVMRIKFNPKTGQPYIDPRTGGPYMEHEYSDTLLCLLLKKHFPEYREQRGDISVTTNTQNNLTITPERLAEIQEARRVALERN